MRKRYFRSFRSFVRSFVRLFRRCIVVVVVVVCRWLSALVVAFDQQQCRRVSATLAHTVAVVLKSTNPLPEHDHVENRRRRRNVVAPCNQEKVVE